MNRCVEIPGDLLYYEARDGHVEIAEDVQECHRILICLVETEDELIAIYTDERTRSQKSRAESL